MCMHVEKEMFVILVVHRIAVAGDEVLVNIQKDILSGVSLNGSPLLLVSKKVLLQREGLHGPHDWLHCYLPLGGALPPSSQSQD